MLFFKLRIYSSSCWSKRVRHSHILFSVHVVSHGSDGVDVDVDFGVCVGDGFQFNSTTTGKWSESSSVQGETIEPRLVTYFIIVE